jgi:hypothetical protein
MGNDGDIAYRLAHRVAFSFFWFGQEALGLGEEIRQFTTQCGTFYCISSGGAPVSRK